VVETC